jgi:hypothetical protein
VFQLSKVIPQTEHSKLAIWRPGPWTLFGCKRRHTDRIGYVILTCANMRAKTETGHTRFRIRTLLSETGQYRFANEPSCCGRVFLS